MWRHFIPPRSKSSEPSSAPIPRPVPLKVPTLVQVARLAGVGIGTASRVLNNEGYVSEHTAARVRAVIEQLAYKPNEVARNLKVRRSGAIGIVVPSLADPFFAATVQAAQIVIRSSGNLSMLAFSEGSSATEAQEIDYLVRRQIDGILILPAGGEAAHLSAAALRDKPLVSFDQPIPGRASDAVLVRNKEGAITATEHLLAHGHRRIAALGVHKHLHSMQKRVEGFREAMLRAGRIPDICMLEPEFIAAQLDHWLASRNPPTAILALSGLASTLLLSALAAHNIRVPDQIALIGFDDFPQANLLTPPLTVVRQPAAKLGAEAATFLLKRIANSATPGRRIALETELVLRQSCGC